MSVENAAKFLKDMREDLEARKKAKAKCKRIIDDARQQVLLEIRQLGYEFTIEELKKASKVVCIEMGEEGAIAMGLLGIPASVAPLDESTESLLGISQVGFTMLS